MGLQGKQPGLLVAVLVPALLSTLVVIARSRRKVKRRPSYINKTGALAAEILLVLSVISGWVSGVFVILSMHYGFGTHQEQILAKPNGMQSLINAAFWQTTGYTFNVGCYTLSVAGQVIHYRTWLFHNLKTSGLLSTAMNASGILQVVFGVICIICVFVKCSPVQANWSPMVQDPVCWPESVFLGLNYTSSALTFVSYIIQGIIPIQMALSLNQSGITRKQWIGLSTIAFWNVIAGVLSLIKLSYLHLYVSPVDATWRRVILVEIGLAENGASGIVPSCAEMWAMAQQMVDRSNSHTKGSRTTYSSHGLPQRPQSSSSRVELTDSDAADGITKTIAWETSTDMQLDTQSTKSDHDGQGVDWQPANVLPARSKIGHT